MNCDHCNGAGKYRIPNDQDRFEKMIDVEMEKGYHVNYIMAREEAYKKVGYSIVDCPHCKERTN